MANKDQLVSVLINQPAASDPKAIYRRNKAYAAEPSVMANGYKTPLNPLQEMAFQQWLKTHGVPFDDSPTSDYDMRGFYKAQQQGNPNAQTSVNENDGMPHFSDQFKTPYHESFSAESKYATEGAPNWNIIDQLRLPNGNVVIDEKKNALIRSLLNPKK